VGKSEGQLKSRMIAKGVKHQNNGEGEERYHEVVVKNNILGMIAVAVGRGRQNLRKDRDNPEFTHPSDL